MSLFKKKKEEKISRDEEIDRIIESDSSKSVPSSGSIGADVERIKAQIDAINEMRKNYSEKFSRISEQIGELRSMLFEKEKEMQHIELKASKASDLVESVQPEKLFIELKKEDVKIESIKSKIESYQILAEKLRDEMKELRTKMSTFRGIEETLEMNKEIRSDIQKIKKIEASVEIHADKVESIFGEIQKTFEEYKQFKNITNSLAESFKEISKEFNTIKTKAQTIVAKEDFYEFKEKTNQKLIYFDKSISDMKQVVLVMQKMNQEIINKLEKGFVSKEKVSNTKNFEKRLNAKQDEILKRVDKWSEEHINTKPKRDVSKIRNLINVAKKAMKDKNLKEVKSSYLFLKDEYESLASSKKGDFYEEMTKIYNWIKASE